MKQVFATSKGILLGDTTKPSVAKGQVLIKVLYSCISAGTEMHNVMGIQKGIVDRIKESPSRINKAIDVLRENGLQKTIEQVNSSMERLTTTGYSVSGIVEEVGAGVEGFSIGDYVSAGGADIAVHAEYVSVPKNLVVKVPHGLNMAYASMGTVGSIAMQGIRRADLKLGEYGVVVGCGLMGLLAIQMLKASGVKVACTDVNDSRLSFAKELGADKIINSSNEDPVNAVMNWTGGFGSDAVLFTAATQSSEPLSQSFQMCRRKGKVVLLGVSGMTINRGDIYTKELDFMISTSYGPGRYDSNYESRGIDYPYAYVRWTENRNIYSFLELIQNGSIDIPKMNPQIYDVSLVADAFNGIKERPGSHIITILDYTKLNDNGSIKENKDKCICINTKRGTKKDRVTIGLIGAGGFATGTLLPIIYQNDKKFRIKTIVNRTGAKAINAAKQFNAEQVSENIDDILNDSEIDLVMVCTRHGNHAELVLKSLQSGKNVYVEKPLATTSEQLNSIKNFYAENQSKESKPWIMVGFNRRFSPFATEIKRHIDNRVAPVFVRYRMNAGFIPSDVWVHGDGGRIIGECCHIIDLAQYLVGKEVTNCYESHFVPQAGMYLSEDNRFITMEFSDGSVVQIEYFACGNSKLPKETMEVHWEGKSIILNDYKSLEGYGIKVKSFDLKVSDKGHRNEWLHIYDSFKNGTIPVDLNSLFLTTEISIESSKD